MLRTRQTNPASPSKFIDDLSEDLLSQSNTNAQIGGSQKKKMMRMRQQLRRLEQNTTVRGEEDEMIIQGGLSERVSEVANSNKKILEDKISRGHPVVSGFSSEKSSDHYQQSLTKISAEAALATRAALSTKILPNIVQKTMENCSRIDMFSSTSQEKRPHAKIVLTGIFSSAQQNQSEREHRDNQLKHLEGIRQQEEKMVRSENTSRERNLKKLKQNICDHSEKSSALRELISRHQQNLPVGNRSNHPSFGQSLQQSSEFKVFTTPETLSPKIKSQRNGIFSKNAGLKSISAFDNSKVFSYFNLPYLSDISDKESQIPLPNCKTNALFHQKSALLRIDLSRIKSSMISRRNRDERSNRQLNDSMDNTRTARRSTSENTLVGDTYNFMNLRKRNEGSLCRGKPQQNNNSSQFLKDVLMDKHSSFRESYQNRSVVTLMQQTTSDGQSTSRLETEPTRLELRKQTKRNVSSDVKLKPLYPDDSLYMMKQRSSSQYQSIIHLPTHQKNLRQETLRLIGSPLK